MAPGEPPAAASATVLIASYLAAMLSMPAAPALGRAAWFVAAAIPVAVLLVFIQRRLAQGAVAGLVVELGARAPRVPRRVCGERCPVRSATRR